MSDFTFTPTVELAMPSANGSRFVAPPAGGVHVAKSRPGRKIMAGALARAMGASQPGSWASDHRLESEKYTGWNYVAINAIAKQAAQADCKAYHDDDAKTAAKRASLRKTFRASRFKCGTQAFNNTLRKTYGDEDAEEALPADHPLVKILKRPNPTQSGATFRFEYILQIRLTGTCLIWNRPNQLGLPVERYVIPTAVAQPQAPSRELPRGGYLINPLSAKQWMSYSKDNDGFTENPGWYQFVNTVLPMGQMQIIRYPHPTYKDDGQSPVAATALWNDTSEAIDKAQHGQVNNGANPGGFVTTSEDGGEQISEAELDRLSKKIEQKFAGPENNGKIVILSGGLDFKPNTFSPRDMVYEASRPQYRDMILAGHATPAIAAGISEGGSYAAFVASMRQFIMLAVQPDLDLLAEEDTEQLARKFGPGLTVEYEAVMIDDPQQLESMLQTDISAQARTKDEHRAERGLPPLPDGKGAEMVGPAAPAGGPPGMGGPGGPPQGQGGGFGGGGGFGAAQGEGGLSGQSGGFGGLPGDGAGAADVGGLPAPQGGEFADKGRRQWKSSLSSRDEILAKVAEGSYRPERGVVELTMLGITEQTAQRLVDVTLQADAEEEDENDGMPVGGMTAKTLRRFVERAVRKCGGKGGTPGPCPFVVDAEQQSAVDRGELELRIVPSNKVRPRRGEDPGPGKIVAYRQAMARREKFPMITVEEDSLLGGHYIIEDGNHRLAAYEKRKISNDVPVLVIKKPTDYWKNKTKSLGMQTQTGADGGFVTRDDIMKAQVERAVRKCGGKGGKPGPCPEGKVEIHADKTGSRNYERRIKEGWEEGSAMYTNEEPHHKRSDGGAWTYENMHDGKREALLAGIIEGHGVGKAEVWLRWSEKGGTRLVRTTSAGIEEVRIPDDVVLNFNHSEEKDGNYDDFEATIGRKKSNSKSLGMQTQTGADGGYLARQVNRAGQSTETNPTSVQKETGDYAKGRVRIGPLDVYIENPRGSTRSGVAPDGKAWSQTMQSHYGYINRAGRADAAKGADGDHVDVFVGPDPDSEVVYVVDQTDGQGNFDEHKALVGWHNERDAVAGYLANYTPGWEVGPVTVMTRGQFVEWLKNGDTTKPVAESLGLPAAAPIKGGEVYQMPVGGLFNDPDNPPVTEGELEALAALAKSYLASE